MKLQHAERSPLLALVKFLDKCSNCVINLAARKAVAHSQPPPGVFRELQEPHLSFRNQVYNF